MYNRLAIFTVLFYVINYFSLVLDIIFSVSSPSYIFIGSCLVRRLGGLFAIVSVDDQCCCCFDGSNPFNYIC